jgi:hypothetical protein
MLGDLSPDIIGTDPKYPSIVDHTWLAVDPNNYDNYPSDNNPVRVVPKLSELWEYLPQQTGVNLVPNAKVMPLGLRSAEEDSKAIPEVVREAKKAVMSGLKGKDLADHLRARFSLGQLKAAAEGLKEVSGEVGLLGNVYIDASAFRSYKEAEQFFRQHRGRLARDIVMNSETMSPNVVSLLAGTFRKNVVSSIQYDENLFSKYKEHLVAANRIPEDFVIDSKEALRQAFLYKKPEVVQKKASSKPQKKISAAQQKTEIEKAVESNLIQAAEDQDALLMSRIIPVVSFVQEQLAKGKRASDLKDMVRTRFLMEDIAVAKEAIALALSEKGLKEDHIDHLIKEGSITRTLGQGLKKIAKQYPIKETEVFEERKAAKPVGIRGFFYSLRGKKASDELDKYRDISVEALRKGFEPHQVRAKLKQKLSSGEADRVLSDAMSRLNAMPAGAVANQPQKPEKIALVPDPEPREVLPKEESIIPQIKEIYSFYEGGEMEVNLDSDQDFSPLELGEFGKNTGIDETL